MTTDGRRGTVEQNGDEVKLSAPREDTVLLAVEGPRKGGAD